MYKLEKEIPAFLIAELGHAPLESHIEWRRSRLSADRPDAQHLHILLRAYGERPPYRGATKKPDELPSPHVRPRLRSKASYQLKSSPC
jgi:hypothetical protein